LTFAITWGLGACVIFFSEPFRALFGELTGFHPLYILAVAAPTLAATMLTLAWEGWSGLRGLWASLTRWRFGFQWYVFALVVIPVLGWLTSRVAGADPKYDLSTPTLVAAALLNLLIGPLGEELGWRGYALPRLLRRFNPCAASLILGAIWGLWHLPSFFVSSQVQADLSLPIFLVGALCLSIIATWLFQHTGGSVLITVVLHYAVNFSLSVLGAPFPAFTLVLLVLAIFVLVLDKDFGWFRKALSRPGPYELRSVT
jgi:membrane protease YdiL (CAAX protease family)